MRQWILFLTFWRQWEFNQDLSREQIPANIAYGMLQSSCTLVKHQQFGLVNLEYTCSEICSLGNVSQLTSSTRLKGHSSLFLRLFSWFLTLLPKSFICWIPPSDFSQAFNYWLDVSHIYKHNDTYKNYFESFTVAKEEFVNASGRCCCILGQHCC